MLCLATFSAAGVQAAAWSQYKMAGFKAFESGNLPRALEYFESALILAHDERAPAEEVGGILENLASVYFALGNAQDAWGSIEQWDKLLLEGAGRAWASEQKAVRDPLAQVISEALSRSREKRARLQDAASPSAPAAAPVGDYAIHLESAGAASNVGSSWDRLQAAYPAQIADKSLLVQEVDLGDRGTFFRILAAPYPDAADAGAACQALESLGQYCAIHALEQQQQ